jgi:hypothetical protein
MAKRLKRVEPDFLRTAPHRWIAQAHIPHPISPVFAAIAEHPENWHEWFPGFAKGGRYVTPAPYGEGATREMKVAGLPVTETILVWEAPRRWAFFVERATMPGIDAFAEDYVLSSVDEGHTTLTWTLAAELAPAMKLGAPLLGAPAKALIRRAAKNLDRYLVGRG